MATPNKSLYETDFFEWSARTAELLRERRFDELDIESTAEEIEDLGKSHYFAVRSHLRRLLMHQIKRRIQPERESPSWRASILDSQTELADKLEASPSLRPRILRSVQVTYESAVKAAAIETQVSTDGLPKQCPFTLDQLLNDFDLVWPDKV